MITLMIVLYADSSTMVEFNNKTFTVYSLDKGDKLTRLLGYAHDFDEAKAIIHSSFDYVSKIVALSKILQTK